MGLEFRSTSFATQESSNMDLNVELWSNYPPLPLFAQKMFRFSFHSPAACLPSPPRLPPPPQAIPAAGACAFPPRPPLPLLSRLPCQPLLPPPPRSLAGRCAFLTDCSSLRAACSRRLLLPPQPRSLAGCRSLHRHAFLLAATARSSPPPLHLPPCCYRLHLSSAAAAPSAAALPRQPQVSSAATRVLVHWDWSHRCSH